MAGVSDGVPVAGLRGQFVLGLTLGIVWSPCVGPTLGAASLLAAQERELAQVSLTMLAFGLGASLPLIGIGLLSRRLLAQCRGSLAAIGHRGKTVLGGLACLVGMFILTGLDRPLEALLVSASPEWLSRQTSQF